MANVPLVMLAVSRLVRFVPIPYTLLVTVRLPITVRVVAPASWVSMALAMLLVPVNMAMVSWVPVPIMPFPAPAQLPVVRQTMPVVLGKVMTWGDVAVPVSLKLLVVVPPRYMSRKGLILLPRSMVDMPGVRLVFMATLLRLFRLVLAPPPLPPRQLPLLRQMVPEVSGIIMLLLVVGVVKDRVLVFMPLV